VIGLWLARELGYAYLDTGALYRAIALMALRHGVAVSDGERLTSLVGAADLELEPGGSRGFQLFLGGEDVTAALFEAYVNEAVSPVAAHAGVRAALLPIQRRLAAAGRVVMVGRDIGTVVMPGAELKLYLDASLEERALRRWEQEGRAREFSAVLEDVRGRDLLDSERASSPLRAASDAVVLMTDGMGMDEEMGRIRELVGM